MAKTKAPEGETPEQRFIRVAGLRVSNVVQGLDLIGQMGADVPDQAMTDQAFAAIQSAVDKAKSSWQAKNAAGKKRVFGFATPQVDLPHTAAPAAKPAQAARR